MANTYSPLLRLICQTIGSNKWTWGNYENTNVTELLEQAIAGVSTIDLTGLTGYTLTSGNGIVDESRSAVIILTGDISSSINVVCPSVTKSYIVINNTSTGYAVTFTTASGTGISVPNGATMLVLCDGTNVVEGISGVFPSLNNPSNPSTGKVVLNTASDGALCSPDNLTFDGIELYTPSLSVTAYDATINGITAGLGAGAVSSNTVFGNGSLAANTTGPNNTAVGYNALASNTYGGNNTCSGYESLLSNVSGNHNAAFGYQSLKFNVSGGGNSALGYRSLINNTGIYNTAIGYQTLYYNTTGNYNTVVGMEGLINNQSGIHNVGLGARALQNVTTGSGNTAINPYTSAGAYLPVFNPSTESNRFCMGSTGVTNAYIQVAWTVVSDARDKTDFAPVPHGLDFVTKLKPTAYRYKVDRDSTEGHGPLRYGFKAQDVLEIEGENPVVVDNEDVDKLRFNDQSLIAILVNAIQELESRVKQLESNK